MMIVSHSPRASVFAVVTAATLLGSLLQTASGFTATAPTRSVISSSSVTTMHPMIHHPVLTTTPPRLMSAFGPLQMAVKNEEDEDELSPSDTSTSTRDLNKPIPEPTIVRKNELAKSNPKKNKTNPSVAIATATAMLTAALTLAPLSASAAMSGGRMGGSFSAPRSSSYSRTMPSRSSYSSGYSRGYSSGFGSGYYSRPAVTIAPISPIVTTPYYGGGVGAVGYSTPFFFGGFFNIMVLALGAFAVLNALPGLLGSTMQETSTSWLDDTDSASSALGPGTTVMSVSVALQVPNRDDRSSILSVLNRLSQTAATDSRVGIQSLTSQVAMELLRKKSSIVSASTRSKHFGSRLKAERDYNQRSVQERSKFEQETVSKYGGVDYGTKTSSLPGGRDGDDKATMAVVTILLAIDGDSMNKLPAINSVGDVEEVLRRIASDAKVEDCLQSAEILWTPEDRTETLSLRDVVADYPELRTV